MKLNRILLLCLLLVAPQLARAQSTTFPVPPLNGFRQCVNGYAVLCQNPSGYMVPCTSTVPLNVTISGGGRAPLRLIRAPLEVWHRRGLRNK